MFGLTKEPLTAVYCIAVILLLAVIFIIYRSAMGKKVESMYNEETEDSEEEIIAAIMAAICSYSGLKAEQFEIKSISVVNSSGKAWRKHNLLS